MRQWPNRFPGVRVPCKSAMVKMKDKLLKEGTLLNMNKGRSGRPRSARSAANLAAVQQELQNNPRMGTRRNGQPQLSRSSFMRIIHEDLELHPYRIQKRHGLQQGDAARRLVFCNWLLNRPQRFLREVIVVDEAKFSMNGSVTTW